VAFAEAVLVGCQARDIHTAVETCGAASWSRVKRLADRSDLILYDLKLIDEEQHRQWTGAGNRQILENARRLAKGGYNVQIRVPLIPEVTDTAENLGRLFAFMCEAGLKHVALLPYNPSAGAKYEWLGKAYRIQAEPQDGECLAGLVAQAKAAGLEAEVQ
jgi:pyruvate formate lyase activating enzyme